MEIMRKLVSKFKEGIRFKQLGVKLVKKGVEKKSAKSKPASATSNVRI